MKGCEPVAANRIDASFLEEWRLLPLLWGDGDTAVHPLLRPVRCGLRRVSSAIAFLAAAVSTIPQLSSHLQVCMKAVSRALVQRRVLLQWHDETEAAVTSVLVSLLRLQDSFKRAQDVDFQERCLACLASVCADGVASDTVKFNLPSLRAVIAEACALVAEAAAPSKTQAPASRRSFQSVLEKHFAKDVSAWHAV